MKTQALLLGALILGGVCVSTPARAQLDTVALQSALDGALANTLASGGAAAIVGGGQVLWHGQSGVIAPGSATAVGPDTLFAYASVGKMTTATLTLRLVEQGLVALDSPIGTYLPASANVPGAEQVTVRQLLNHTSGYPDLYTEPGVVARLLDQDHPWTAAELIAETRAPTTTPGTVHAYSNTNYILLSEIVARASGESFGAFYQSQIASPLGLTHSFVTPRPREEFAQGVRGAGDEAINFFDLTNGVPSALYGEIFGDSPLVGTAADGALFLDGLLGGEVLGAETLGQMLDFDPMTGYGLGIASFTAGDATWIGHNGSWGGFTAWALYNTELDLTFMTVANHEADTEGQPFAALALMEAVTAAATPIPEPAAASALVAGSVLVASVLHRRPRRAADASLPPGADAA